MDLENQIEELQHQLALKNAYLKVNISFGKQNRAFSEEIKAEVIKTLTECAVKLAEGVKNPVSSTSFTEEEVNVLKSVAKSVISRNKVSKPAPATEEKATLVEAPPVKEEGIVETATSTTAKRGVLLLTDNVDKKVRQNVMPNSEVNILSKRADRYFVEDSQGIRFWVPSDDLELTA